MTVEFNEKLQQLRKNRGLTQEELAKELFVSRTAISKWESGRGYPNIDSLKELSRFFSVTIDELIGSQELLAAAEEDKQETLGTYISQICGLLDMFSALLLFLPIFGNGSNAAAVSLSELCNISEWIRLVFAAVIAITVLNGISALIISHWEKPVWNRHRLITGLGLSILGSAVFIISRQPYAAMICFTVLIIKGCLLFKETIKK